MEVRLRFTAYFMMVACCTAMSCARDDDALALVGDRRLELAEFQDYVVEASGEAWQGAESRVCSRLLDQFIDRQVVLAAARSRDVLTTADATSMSPRELRRIMAQLCGEPPEPDETAVEAEVGRRARIEVPARAHARQILVDTLEEAQAARKRLLGGADFVEVSREVSRAPNAGDGGELGFFFQDSLPPEIDRVVFSLAPGAISEPVQGTSGYHVFQVLEVVEPGLPNRAEVEAAVRAELGLQTAREHTRGCVSELAAEIGVRVKSDRLWFPYRGRYMEGRDHV
jgi:peptidyl-prolyl cis-trans isomerase C